MACELVDLLFILFPMPGRISTVSFPPAPLCPCWGSLCISPQLGVKSGKVPSLLGGETMSVPRSPRIYGLCLQELRTPKFPSAISSCHLLVTAPAEPGACRAPSRAAASAGRASLGTRTGFQRQPGKSRAQEMAKSSAKGTPLQGVRGESIPFSQNAEGQAGFKRCSKLDDLLETNFFLRRDIKPALGRRVRGGKQSVKIHFCCFLLS